MGKPTCAQVTLPTSTKTFTENCAATLATSGSSRVDLFFKLTRDVVKNDMFIPWLAASWEEDPLDTMKLLFNSRDCRGGKGDRAPFLAGVGWVSYNHPAWFKANLRHGPTYGRWLDVVELLPHVQDSHANFIIELLAVQLQMDHEFMSYSPTSVSLAAKWVPTENKKWDRRCNITAQLCQVMYGADSSERRWMLRTTVITPLRQFLDVVERRMCTGSWDNINFSKVRSTNFLPTESHRLR